MNYKRILIYSLSLVIILFGLWQMNDMDWEFSDEEETQQTLQTTVDPNHALPMGIGSPEDRYGRLEWEKSRLVDPATGELPPNIRQRELAFAANLPKRIATNKANGANWQKRGPYNVGGRTRAFAFDKTDENTFLVGGVTGGMWRTTNGGQSYVKTTTPEQLHSVTSVAQDTRTGKTDTWYYGTGEYYGVISTASFSNQASGNGIFKSTDGGQSWDLLPSTVSNTPTTLYKNLDFDFVWKVVTNHTNVFEDVVFAAVINGICRSKDGGATWEAVLGLDSNAVALSNFTTLEITPNGVLYAGLSSDGNGGGGIFRSSDGGDSWTEITPVGFPNSFRRIVMAHESDENKMYVLTQSPNTGTKGHNLWHYTYLSGDGSGNNGAWDNRSANIPVGSCTGYFDFEFESYSSQSSYDMCMVIKPDNPNVVILGGTNVYVSTDGFTSDSNWTWQGGYNCDTLNPSNYVHPSHHPDQHLFTFLPSDPNVLYTANDGGIYKTNNIMGDTVQYESLNNGYVTTQFYTLAIEEGNVNNDIVIGGMQDNGTIFTNTSDEVSPWSAIFVGDGSFCGISSGRDYYYLSIQNGRVYKCEVSDLGVITSFSRIDPTGGSGYRFINSFILNPTNTNEMFLAGGRFIWRNSILDSIPITFNAFNTISQGWERINESNVGSIQTTPTISALDMSAANDSFLFYGTSTGGVYRLDSMNSKNYNKVTLSHLDFPGLGSYVSSIVQNEQNADEVIVTFSNYETRSMFYSNDRGNTWSDIGGNLEENLDGTGDGPSVIWSGILPLGDSTIYYSGTSIGLFSATVLDGANTVWEMEGPSMIGNVIINAIQTRVHDGLVVIGTHGNGIYSARYKNVTSVPEVLVDITFSLAQNAPNPFSEQTTFTYTLVNREEVELTIYTMDGREVKRLLDKVENAGEHTVNWNGTDYSGNRLPAGTYIYEIKVGSQKTANKLIISR